MSSEQDNGATPPSTGGGNQNKNNPGGEKGKQIPSEQDGIVRNCGSTVL